MPKESLSSKLKKYSTILVIVTLIILGLLLLDIRYNFVGVSSFTHTMLLICVVIVILVSLFLVFSKNFALYKRTFRLLNHNDFAHQAVDQLHNRGFAVEQAGSQTMLISFNHFDQANAQAIRLLGKENTKLKMHVFNNTITLEGSKLMVQVIEQFLSEMGYI